MTATATLAPPAPAPAVRGGTEELLRTPPPAPARSRLPADYAVPSGVDGVVAHWRAPSPYLVDDLSRVRGLETATVDAVDVGGERVAYLTVTWACPELVYELFPRPSSWWAAHRGADGDVLADDRQLWQWLAEDRSPTGGVAVPPRVRGAASVPGDVAASDLRLVDGQVRDSFDAWRHRFAVPSPASLRVAPQWRGHGIDVALHLAAATVLAFGGAPMRAPDAESGKLAAAWGTLARRGLTTTVDVPSMTSLGEWDHVPAVDLRANIR